MAEEEVNPEEGDAQAGESALQGGAYEVLRQRLQALNRGLTDKVEAINSRRKEVFGGQDSAIIGSDRIQTDNNCVPRDTVHIGSRLLFGYNVYFGLKSETTLEDVFVVQNFDGTEFHREDLSLINNPEFIRDFKELYKYYKHARFLQFICEQSNLYFVFQTGETVDDFKMFRWQVSGDSINYVDNRGDVQYKVPPQHEFEWRLTGRDEQIAGVHPHITIEDQVFVETVGGDLTIKIENNTESGEGIYTEPVENPDQTLDDAHVSYAILGNLILLKIQPYQETVTRYFIFDKRNEAAVREDSLSQACVQLPEGHGIIFPRGCYLQSGEVRQFQDDISGMAFQRVIRSPNGEDYLYVFYEQKAGRYILIQYNLIAKNVENPIFCHGFSIFSDGKMVLFSADAEEAKKLHAMQIWQTPFFDETHEAVKDDSSYLAKIGNRDLVRGLSECYAISRLINQETASLRGFEDIIQACTDLLDSYHWLTHEEVSNLSETLHEVRTAAIAAVDEYEKVQRIRDNTQQQLAENAKDVETIVTDTRFGTRESVDEFVDLLSRLRTRRGHVISLRELRYTDAAQVDAMEEQLQEAYDNVSLACVDFLLKGDAFAPYHEHVAKTDKALEKIDKLADLKPVEEELEDLSGRLDVLTEVVNNLNVEDKTKTTQIVDAITDIYGLVNRTKATARGLRLEVSKGEASAEFGAQYKLLSQSITNFIGLCDAPEKCDEYLTKVMLTIEELEGRFADFDDFIEQLTEKREEAYNAFTNRKQVLEEERQRRINSLLSSSGRILKGIANRAATFKTVDEINAYYASDLMVIKLKEIIQKLVDLGDTVKADDLSGQLKSSKDDTVRKLRDTLELFDGDDNLIKFGDYKFSVNTQALELTTVMREEGMCFHLTGTDYYEDITDPEFLKTKSLWDQELVSESRDVYRAEFLAYKILQAALKKAAGLSLELLTKQLEDDKALEETVRTFSADLYNEGYERGVHDHDAVLILRKLVTLYNRCGLLRYDSESRAHAIIFWCYYQDEAHKQRLRDTMHSIGILRTAFGEIDANDGYVDEIARPMAAFYEAIEQPVGTAILRHAAEFLYYELQDHDDLVFTINELAQNLYDRFTKHLKRKKVLDAFAADIGQLKDDLPGRIRLILDWIQMYVAAEENEDATHLIWEVVALLVADDHVPTEAEAINTFEEVPELLGQHPNIVDKALPIHFDRFLLKMHDFLFDQVPLFETFGRLRNELADEQREEMRLSEFKPKVMGSFVRNKLINDVYLPLVGANFAKQMGAAGAGKRTDLMGLLLLISPPGYGKTTLMEYVANRLGLTFMKINGPAIGHQVGSLDPMEAPNATAREELEKLNLSLVMGNNVMIYLDDIQHLNPEFLQKFISLCDAQRKIEGVYKGVTRTYDLRGKKVSVVMAGNPYTESGDKFQIPDMLANRADTYNLGDVGSSHGDAFALSFIENAMTSNPVLATLTSRSQADLYRFVDIARTGNAEGVDFDHDYSAQEVDELVNVLKHMLRVQDIVLKVNEQYIASAAQQDEYRTEPPFKMQGSYRNMNRMAEKVYAIMTADEVDQLIMDHYNNESQTLTSGAESNLLKFKEIMDVMTAEELERLTEIRREFNRRQTLSGADEQDKIAQVISQLSTFNSGIDRIREMLERGISGGLQPIADAARALQDKTIDLTPLTEVLSGLGKVDVLLENGVTQHTQSCQQLGLIVEQLTAFNDNVGKIQALMADGELPAPSAPGAPADPATGGRVNKVLDQQLQQFNDSVSGIRQVLQDAMQGTEEGRAQLDLTPVVEQLQALRDKQDAVEVAAKFPAEYSDAWSTQNQILEKLLPLSEMFAQQSEAFVQLKQLIENLTNGTIRIEVQK